MSSILIIEDNPSTIGLLREILEKKGYSVFIATSGEKGLKRVKTINPDLIILDILMPGIDGYETCKLLKKDEETKDIPVIFASALNDSVDKVKAFEVGGVDFISKPIDIEEVIARVKTHLTIISLQKELNSININLEKSIKDRTKELEDEVNLNKSLVTISKKLLREKDLSKVYNLILNKALKLTDSKFGFVGYIDPKTGYLVSPTLTEDIWNGVCHVKDVTPIFKEFKGLWGWVLINKKAILTNSVSSDPRSSGVPKGHVKIERFLSTPVMNGEELVGQIAVANASRNYNQQDIKALENLSTIFAIVIEKYWREKKEIENERMLIQQSKMASMGEMIGAIAHQWKQPLNLISIYTADLTLLFEDGELNQENINKFEDNISKQLNYMSQTINDFRDFFKPSKEQEKFLACESISEVYKLLEAKMKKREIKLIIHEHRHFLVLGYPNEFKQVILNILNNTIDIFDEREVIDGEINVFIKDDSKVGTIIISDNGGGIASELLPNKLFESYVTTKGDKGTGIGLQIAKYIIEDKMEGSIKAKNSDKGAEFIIELPIIEIK